MQEVWRADDPYDVIVGTFDIQQAIGIALRAFPTLLDVEEQKISFAVSPEADMAYRGPLISILDDAWDALAESMATRPRTMLVGVRETPQDAQRRGLSIIVYDGDDGGKTDHVPLSGAGIAHERLPMKIYGGLALAVLVVALGLIFWINHRSKLRGSQSLYTAVQSSDIELEQQVPPYTAVPSSDVELGRRATTQDDQGLTDKHQVDGRSSHKHQDE